MQHWWLYIKRMTLVWLLSNFSGLDFASVNLIKLKNAYALTKLPQCLQNLTILIPFFIFSH